MIPRVDLGSGEDQDKPAGFRILGSAGSMAGFSVTPLSGKTLQRQEGHSPDLKLPCCASETAVIAGLYPKVSECCMKGSGRHAHCGVVHDRPRNPMFAGAFPWGIFWQGSGMAHGMPATCITPLPGKRRSSACRKKSVNAGHLKNRTRLTSSTLIPLSMPRPYITWSAFSSKNESSVTVFSGYAKMLSWYRRVAPLNPRV